MLVPSVQSLTRTRLLPWWAWALVTAECVPLLARRRLPFATEAAVGAATALHGVVPVPEPFPPWAALVAVYGVAAHARRRLALAAAGIVAVLSW